MQSSQSKPEGTRGTQKGAAQALDRLIQLARVQGILDLRCLLNGPLQIDHGAEPKGIAAYHVVLAGTCLLQMPGLADLQLGAGDIVLLPRGQTHLIQILGEAKPQPPATHFNGALLVRSNVASGVPALDLLCGRFAYAYPTALIDALPDVIHVRSMDSDMDALVATMRREAEAAQPGAVVIVGAMSTALFAMTLRSWLSSAPQLAGVLALLSHARVSQAVTAMLDAPGEPWTIALLAKRAAMSRASFMRAYASLSSDTPLESLARMRMQQASQLLAHSTRKISDIAAAVGYLSEAAFAKKFKEVFQLPPGQFRAQHQTSVA